MRSMKDLIGRAADRLLGTVAPKARAAAWCCGSVEPCTVECWRDCHCNANNRLCCRICSTQLGSGATSCGAYNCNAAC
ncbi:hypothetical protein Afil01_67760 [Actinorhabdospora filicis]|uniref:Uncharacterized protein n=1 Tax=Actinorhabdospora filicis TaxID=1785913 RepID=A0A9W6SU28_9ACTN|nr:hypothetical protein [Actinorhabdospora filicis]GLZ81969.1 hypothetical protein Afil01_67760 [Actinorhabdospora filicis]